jgi:peptidyl-prolyl cis-trans isomerase C
MTTLSIRTIVAIAMLAILLSAPVLAAAEDKPDRQIALVNDMTVLRQDLDREMKLVSLRLSRQGQPIDAQGLKRYEGQLRETLINRALLLQQSQALGVDVNPSLVTKALDAFKAGFQNADDYTRSLREMGFTEEEMTGQIKNGLVIKTLIDKEVIDTLTVSDGQIRSFYEDNPDLFRRPEQVKASHILVQVPENADEAQKAQAQAAIRALKQRIDNGEDFATLAMDHSACPSKAKGGDLGFFGREEMVAPFSEAAFALQPGQVSDVVTTRFGFHLIRVTERQAEEALSFNDVKDAIATRLRQEQEEQRIAAYIEKLKEHAVIKRFPL